MIASFPWAVVSWVFWLTWVAVAIVYEVFAVMTEKRTGALPLTRVVRDRLMRRHTLVKLGVVFFLFWLLVHFTLPLDW